MRIRLNNNSAECTRLCDFVYSFRDAIDKAKEDDMFKNHKRFRYFPRGCCDDTCYLLSQFLLENGYKCKVIIGSHYEDNIEKNGKHAWIEISRDYVVDITIDQFTHNYSKDRVYVGEENYIHKYYSDDKEVMKPGINQYSFEWREDMRKLYYIIKKYL